MICVIASTFEVKWDKRRQITFSVPPNVLNKVLLLNVNGIKGKNANPLESP